MMSTGLQKKLRILYLEDDTVDRELVASTLRREAIPCELIYAETREEFHHALEGQYDLILCDYVVPGYSGVEALREARQRYPDLPLIFVSGQIGEERTAEALKAGATDYVLKERLERLGLVVRRALSEVALRHEQHAAQEALRNSEQRLRILFEYAPDAYYLNDLRGVLVDGNKAAENLSGYRREELIGKSFLDLDLLDAEARGRAAQELALNAKGQPVGPTEYKLKRKDGSHVIAEIRSYPVTIQGRVLVLGIARNITERKEADRELRASEERFRSVWEHSIDGMRLIDGAGRIIAVNQAYCDLVKMPRERLLGQVFSVVYHDVDKEGVLTDYKQQFAQNKERTQLHRKLQLWNLQELDLDICSSPIESETGGKLLLSIFRDVTGNKRAELETQAFAKLGHQLSSARTAQEAGALIIEVADRLLGWDSCFLCSYSAEEDRIHCVLETDTIAGQRVAVKGPYDNQPPSAFLRRVIVMGGQLILKENVHEMLPGAVAFGDTARPSASVICVPVRNGTEVIGLLSIQSYRPRAYDEASLETLQALADHCAGTFDRVRAQQALEEAQRRLNHLVEESPAVIFSLRFEAGRFKPGWVSRGLEQMLGYHIKEAVEPGWWEQTVHPQDLPALVDWTRQLLQQRQWVREYRLRHKNGEYRWIRDERRLVSDGNGQPMECVGSWVDITERKSLEDLLRQAQKMEAIGLLAGGVAHDFNNLLAVMRGNAELLLLDEERLPEPSRESLQQIIKAAERSANLTRQLLTFSRKQVMQQQPLLLNDVIANLTKMLKRVIGENIELQCHYAASLAHVNADAGMIEQVLVNLVVNARDAMPRGGQLHIGTDQCHISELYSRAHPEARAGHFVCLTVRDNGMGICPEHLPRIFEPFFTTKETGKGTGLGLATAYGIVKQHQGWIEVSSQPNHGATFRVFLPALPAPPKDNGASSAEALVRGGKETILLVEDDYSVRVITRRVLESVGYTVQEASRPREALEIWQRQGEAVSLLLTDVVMPEEMSGRELADQLRSQRANLGIIFMSGYSPDIAGKDTQFFRQTKAYFLQKPCPSKLLLETVRKCLDER